MSETKKRTFSLELTDKETLAFVEKCYRDGTTPAEVLEGFICDLTGAERSRGSDERMLAGDYYERCGYGFFVNEYNPFIQWLLLTFQIEAFAELLDDIKTLEEEVRYLTDHPEEAGKGEVEDLNRDIALNNENIQQMYQEYTEKVIKPDTLEEGIKAVRDYLEMIDRIKEGGTI